MSLRNRERCTDTLTNFLLRNLQFSSFTASSDASSLIKVFLSQLIINIYLYLFFISNHIISNIIFLVLVFLLSEIQVLSFHLSHEQIIHSVTEFMLFVRILLSVYFFFQTVYDESERAFSSHGWCGTVTAALYAGTGQVISPGKQKHTCCSLHHAVKSSLTLLSVCFLTKTILIVVPLEENWWMSWWAYSKGDISSQ